MAGGGGSHRYAIRCGACGPRLLRNEHTGSARGKHGDRARNAAALHLA